MSEKIKGSLKDQCRISNLEIKEIAFGLKKRAGIHIISITDISNYHKGHFLLFLENTN